MKCAWRVLKGICGGCGLTYGHAAWRAGWLHVPQSLHERCIDLNVAVGDGEMLEEETKEMLSKVMIGGFVLFQGWRPACKIWSADPAESTKSRCHSEQRSRNFTCFHPSEDECVFFPSFNCFFNCEGLKRLLRVSHHHTFIYHFSHVHSPLWNPLFHVS